MHQKPAPTESIYKHLSMLANYCEQSAKTDKSAVRKKLLLAAAAKLTALSNSRAVKQLQFYGE